MRADQFSESQLAELIDTGFGGVPLHRHFRLRLVSLDPVTVRMPLGDIASGFLGGVHGGAVATLIDVATNCSAAMSDAFDLASTRLATLDLHIRYLRQPKGDAITATAQLVHEGRSVLQVDTMVRDQVDRLIATATANSMVTPLR